MNSIYQLRELQNIDDSLSEIRSYLGDLPVKVEELKSKETQLIVLDFEILYIQGCGEESGGVEYEK